MHNRNTRTKGRAVWALTSTALLLTGLLTPTAAAAAQPTGTSDRSPGLSNIRDSKTIEGPTLLDGELLSNKTGKPLSDVELTLEVWPANEVLETLQDGETVKLIPVGKATTGEDGQFELRISDEAAVERAADIGGNANFTVSGPNQDSLIDHNFSAPARATARNKAAAMRGSAPEHVSLRGQNNRVAGAAGSDSMQAPAMQKTCYTTKVATYASRPGIVGASYVQTSGVKADFDYSASGTTTSSVGVSYGGTYGSYSSSGSTTVSSNSTITFPAVGANTKRIHRTAFNIGKFRIYCESGSGTPISTRYQVRAYQVAGGNYDYIPANSLTAPSSNCEYYNPDGGQSLDSTRATNWTNGLSLKSQIGIDLSVTSGYSGTVKQVWKFTSRRALCGTNGSPAGTPGTLFARTSK